MLIEWCVWMGDYLVVLGRMFRFEQFLQADDTGQQQRQFTNDQGLEGDQCQETEHQWQKGGCLQFEQQQQWQQKFLGLLSFTTSCIALNPAFPMKNDVRMVTKMNGKKEIEMEKEYRTQIWLDRMAKHALQVFEMFYLRFI